jgi:hypothetical protein
MMMKVKESGMEMSVSFVGLPDELKDSSTLELAQENPYHLSLLKEPSVCRSWACVDLGSR